MAAGNTLDQGCLCSRQRFDPNAGLGHKRRKLKNGFNIEDKYKVQLKNTSTTKSTNVQGEHTAKVSTALKEQTTKQEQTEGINTEQEVRAGWWDVLNPGFCLSGALKLVASFQHGHFQNHMLLFLYIVIIWRGLNKMRLEIVMTVSAVKVCVHSDNP